MKFSSKLRHAGLLVAGLGLVVGLASCGGGSSDNGNPSPVAVVDPTIPPASASADVNGFIAFLKVLVATQDDSGAGLDVSAFVAPMSDTADPDLTI